MKEPGQAAYEEWMLTAFGEDWSRAHDHWEDVPANWKLAWSSAESYGAERERAAVVRFLKSRFNPLAASWIEDCQHLDGADV